jgi:hypothetical protein
MVKICPLHRVNLSHIWYSYTPTPTFVQLIYVLYTYSQVMIALIYSHRFQACYLMAVGL